MTAPSISCEKSPRALINGAEPLFYNIKVFSKKQVKSTRAEESDPEPEWGEWEVGSGKC